MTCGQFCMAINCTRVRTSSAFKITIEAYLRFNMVGSVPCGLWGLACWGQWFAVSGCNTCDQDKGEPGGGFNLVIWLSGPGLPHATLSRWKFPLVKICVCVCVLIFSPTVAIDTCVYFFSFFAAS